jgi:predicted transcriptional regulator
MTKYKIQSHDSLKEEMMAVARGEKPAPEDAGMPSFNSIEALTRLLTPENRELLATIRDRKPQSISELAEITGRAQPNLTRTLAKLETVGFVRMRLVERRKVPTASVRTLHVEIDPFSQNDRLEIKTTKQPGLDDRHRDKDGEISRKHGNTLVSTLRQTYGKDFAPGISGNVRLSKVLRRLDEPSLSHLRRDLRR